MGKLRDGPSSDSAQDNSDTGQTTGPKDFRTWWGKAMLMAYGVTRDLALDEVEVETPSAPRMQSAGRKSGSSRYSGLVSAWSTVCCGSSLPSWAYRGSDPPKPVEYYCKRRRMLTPAHHAGSDVATGRSCAAIGFAKQWRHQHRW